MQRRPKISRRHVCIVERAYLILAKIYLKVLCFGIWCLSVRGLIETAVALRVGMLFSTISGEVLSNVFPG